MSDSELIARLQVLAGISGEPVYFQQNMLPLLQPIIEVMTSQIAREKTLRAELAAKETDVRNLQSRLDMYIAESKELRIRMTDQQPEIDRLKKRINSAVSLLQNG